VCARHADGTCEGGTCRLIEAGRVLVSWVNLRGIRIASLLSSFARPCCSRLGIRHRQGLYQGSAPDSGKVLPVYSCEMRSRFSRRRIKRAGLRGLACCRGGRRETFRRHAIRADEEAGDSGITPMSPSPGGVTRPGRLQHQLAQQKRTSRPHIRRLDYPENVIQNVMHEEADDLDARTPAES
jgi:hypothetical protein